MTSYRVAVFSALVLVASGFGASSALGQAESDVDRVECENYDDGPGGWGGSSMECNQPCDAGDDLRVEVENADADASVSGSFECGGGEAACSDVDNDCNSGWMGPATSDDDNGLCQGSTEETWDSSFDLYCSTRTTTDCNVTCAGAQSALSVEEGEPWAILEFDVLTVKGWTCDSDGCEATDPSCELTDQGRTCWIET
jgi:hypothetical protein